MSNGDQSMKTGTIVAVTLTVVGLCAVIFSFIQNASPYVTVAQAKITKGDNMHLYGEIEKSTIKIGTGGQTVSFDITDEEGGVATVLYKGSPPNNLNEAVHVVAVGGMNGEIYEAHKLMLKCPSKYESEQQGGS